MSVDLLSSIYRHALKTWSKLSEVLAYYVSIKTYYKDAVNAIKSVRNNTSKYCFCALLL